MANHDDLGFVSDEAPGADHSDLGFQADVGFEPESGNEKATRYAVNSARGLGKGLDYLRGGTTAPLLAAALEKLTGKDVYRGSEHLNALDPTKLDTYPSASELYERAGVPEGAKASDYVKGPASLLKPLAGPLAPLLDHLPGLQYGPKGSLIEKGGMLDPTVRGAGGVATDTAIDPLTYASFGSLPALKDSLQAGSKMKNLGRALLDIKTLAKAPSRALQKTGKAIYEGGLLPIIQLGEKKGKQEVAETFYKHNIVGTAGMVEEQIGRAADALLAKRNAILAQADKLGATINQKEAFQPFLDNLATMVRDGRLTTDQADQLVEKALGAIKQRNAPISTSLGSQLKTDKTKSLPKNIWDVTADSTMAGEIGRPLSTGLKTATENSVERALGKDAKDQLVEHNRELGDFLTTDKAAEKMADVGERRHWVTPLDAALASGVSMATNNPRKGMTALAAKKLIELSRTTGFRTPAGWALRKAAENELLSPAFDITVRRWGANRLPQVGKQEDEE